MEINKNLKLALGVVHGKKAFTGPYLVQLDLTNDCNTRCIYCMNYSDLGLKNEHPEGWRNISLDFGIIKSLIPELKSIGVKEIDLTGNGEPFMYPDIMKAVKLIKENGMRCVIRTNGLLIDKGIITELFYLGLDGIDLSLWAGSPESYVELHPCESGDSFLRIKDWLSLLSALKQQHRRRFQLKILNVIANSNYSKIDEMLSFAYEAKADYVIFKYFGAPYFKDVVAEKLLLNSEEKKHLQTIISRSEFKAKVRNNLPRFFKSIDESIVIKKCIFGWFYARLTVTGDVMPCCGCFSHVMGNFKQSAFPKIWFGEKYNEFRKKSRNITGDAYFYDCFCAERCPHFIPVITYKDVLLYLYPKNK